MPLERPTAANGKCRANTKAGVNVPPRRLAGASTVLSTNLAPDQGIPRNLLESAKCIAIIPGDVKFAFIFGGNYGRGLATYRTGHGFSAPMFLAIEGGSVGYQIGVSSTDFVLLFMNDRALQSLLSDKFKLGADASVAAGPVGRNASAGTDFKLNA